MLWARQTSSVFLPLDSASRRMRMICSVVRRVFFTMTHPFPENHLIHNELLHGGQTNAISLVIPFFDRDLPFPTTFSVAQDVAEFVDAETTGFRAHYDPSGASFFGLLSKFDYVALRPWYCTLLASDSRPMIGLAGSIFRSDFGPRLARLSILPFYCRRWSWT